MIPILAESLPVLIETRKFIELNEPETDDIN